MREETRRQRLRQFRDSCGHPVTQWPGRIVPSATVIIVRGAPAQDAIPWQVLCQRRSDNGWWGMPGGAQEPGESIEECAVREALEETGLHIHLHGAVCVDSDPCHYAVCTYPNGIVHYTNVSFLASGEGDALVVSAESLALEWHSMHALPQPFLLNHLWRLEQAWAHRGPFLPVR
jgi:8-oxo-dGTP pyrophosphatase MutT (NUDIX family)